MPKSGPKLPLMTERSIETVADERGSVERWTKPLSFFQKSFPEVMISAIDHIYHRTHHGNVLRHKINISTLKILAYMSVETRLRFLISLSLINKEAVNEILTQPMAPSHEAYRFNILTSLGSFSRHGLVNEVMTQERADIVSRAWKKSVKPKGNF